MTEEKMINQEEVEKVPEISWKEKAKLANENDKVIKVFKKCLIASIVLLVVFGTLLTLTIINNAMFGGATESIKTISMWITIISAVALVLSIIRKQSIFIGLGFANIWMKLEKKYPTVFEFIRYWLVANVTTIIDYIITFLMLWVFFKKLQQTPFLWQIGNFTVFKYSAGDGAGLAAFLAYVISFLGSNIYGFIAQRKIAFRANNNVVVSAIAFTIATLIILFITQFLPQFYMDWLYGLVGAGFGSVLIKFINCCIALWAMYPVNKFIIMRKIEEPKKEEVKEETQENKD